MALLSIPQYLEAYEDCIAKQMTMLDFKNPVKLSFGFIATSKSGEDYVYETGNLIFLNYYRQKQPIPEGAKVENGWISQTLPLNDYVELRNNQKIKSIEMFAKDIKEGL